MNHQQVHQLIPSAAAANGSAAAVSPPPPTWSSESAIIAVAEVYPSPSLPSCKLHQNLKQTTFLTYNERGMQVDQTAFRGDSI